MPQLSSYHCATAGPRNPNLTAREVMVFLDKLSQDLDGEVCAALLEENNELAERLMLPLQQVRKLAQALYDASRA